MRRFQLILALVVALATTVGLRAAARHRHWAGTYGMPGSRFGYGPAAGHCRDGYGRFGRWGRPLPAAPAAPAPTGPATPQ